MFKKEIKKESVIVGVRWDGSVQPQRTSHLSSKRHHLPNSTVATLPFTNHLHHILPPQPPSSHPHSYHFLNTNLQRTVSFSYQQISHQNPTSKVPTPITHIKFQNPMENTLKTPPQAPIQSQPIDSECKTPPPIQKSSNENDQNSSHELRKPPSVTPDRLRVPKAFKYSERYTSPTDSMVSPVTKGLLARGRRGGPLLPPGNNQPKVPDLRVEEVGLFQNKLPNLIDENLSSN